MTSLILIGVITGAHGIKGEVKLKSFAETPSNIAKYGPLQTQSGSTIEITKLRTAKDGFICTLKNVQTRNQSEALRGLELLVPREKLAPAKTDEFYLNDLLNRDVSSGGKTIGKVSGFQNFGAGELIELDNGLLIPLACVESTGDAIIVNLPEGFLDEA
jgi:16S rRNA processing protein RimM